ncbi:MAG: carbonic anhydrase [Chloroflexaceae bacterium]
MHRLVSVDTVEDIFPHYRNTPIEHLLQYHNLGEPFPTCEKPEILIGKCMDYRERLRMPDNFAYVIRAGGANLRYSDFSVSFAIAVGRVYAIALIGHNNCGMVGLMAKKDAFIEGLVQHEGWDEARANEHFMHFAPMFEIDNEIDFVVSEARRLRQRYPNIIVAPMLYRVEDRRLYLIDEEA